MTNEEFEKFQAEVIEEAKKQGVYPAWVMYWLLFAWHDMEYADSFRMTDKRLMELSTVKSRSALRKAKKKLQEAGLIRYTPSYAHGGTTYRIMDMKG